MRRGDPTVGGCVRDAGGYKRGAGGIFVVMVIS